MQGFWCSIPHENSQKSALLFLGTGRLLMGMQDGTVELDLLEVSILAQYMKNVLPYLLVGPAGKADINTIPSRDPAHRLPAPSIYRRRLRPPSVFCENLYGLRVNLLYVPSKKKVRMHLLPATLDRTLFYIN